MLFALDGDPSPSELSNAVNYLLGNLVTGLAANETTGQIIAPGGIVVAYIYKYIAVKYADSFDGSVGFSNSPTNKAYYGLRNTDSPVESTNPADYIWYEATGGFGTTKFLFYLTSGGRSITFVVSTTAPSQFYKQDPGVSIDLDFVTASTSSPANFAVIRAANDFSPPTDVEVLASIGRLPVENDMCIVNYASGTASIQYKYIGGWAVYQKILTGDLIVANSITATNLSVAQLSAITANLGTITAGSLNINNKFTVDASGNTTIKSGTTGARVEIFNNVIKVYDASNILRVKIGDLTA
jgi:hypothetical protein